MLTGKPELTDNKGTAKSKLQKRDIFGRVVFVCITGALFNLSCWVWGAHLAALFCCGVLMLLLVVIIIPEAFKPEEVENYKRDTFVGFAMFFCIAAVLFSLVFFNKLSGEVTYAAALYGFGVLMWMLALIMKDSRYSRMLSEIKDPGERIRKMEEFYAEGVYKNRMLYLNQLSTLYYDKGDAKKALELVREACHIQSGKREPRTGSGMTVSEMLRLNEIVYLAALERFDEVEPLLAPLDDKRYKNPVALYLINASRAQLAIEKGNPKTAREFLNRLVGLSIKDSPERRVNISCHLLLLEAECDLLEKDTDSALAKLDDILARSTWQPHVKCAAELKKSARRKNTDLRRRRLGSRPRQAKRCLGPKYAAARRQTCHQAERKRR